MGPGFGNLPHKMKFLPESTFALKKGDTSEMRILVLLTIFFASTAWAQSFPPEREMRPFKTDGCTMAPEGTINRPNLFHNCCVEHDLRMWGGGTKSERKTADWGLRTCIRKLAGPGYADIYYNAVRLGRLSPVTIRSKRWGNAWYEFDGYRELNEEEITRLLEAVSLLEIDEEMKNAYIKELEERLNSTLSHNQSSDP